MFKSIMIILGVVVSACAALHGAGMQRVRHVDAGPPIADIVEPGDAVVILSRDSEGGISDRKPTVAEAIFDLTVEVGAVAVVDITGATAELVEDGRWINTQMTGAVVEVVRTSSLTLTKGQRVSLTVWGGEMTFGGVLVRAGVHNRRLPVGRYLLFLHPSDDRLVTIPFLLEKGRVAAIWREDLISKDGEPVVRNNVDRLAALAGLPVDDLLRRIRQVR